MPVGNFSYVVVLGPEWPAVISAGRTVEAEFPTRFQNAIDDEANPVIRDVQAAAMALPAYGTKHTGMRAKLAAGVGSQMAPNGIRITTSMREADELGLPRGFDSGLAGFRHPVYGNMNNWVHQIGGSWFREIISDHADDFENALGDVLEEGANTVAHAAGV